MDDNSLYNLAVEMLESTNPYSKPVNAFKYREHDLCVMTKMYLGRKTRSVKKEGALQKDYENCYEAITGAMLKYLEDFRTNSFAYKQDLWRQFAIWIKNIEKKYHIPDDMCKKDFVKNAADGDAVIAIVKALHKRSGNTVQDIAEETNMDIRPVQKWLKKLRTNELNNTGETGGCCRIAGQPVSINIKVSPGKKSKAPRYKTINSMHPIILQENLMEVGTLLQSLAHNYVDNNSDISFNIGIDVWYQLSVYARNRVRKYYAYRDEKLKKFLNDIDCMLPDKTNYGFQTEREMVQVIPGSQSELFDFVMKGEGRFCNLYFKSSDDVLCDQRLEYTQIEDEIRYWAIDENGNRIEICIEDIEEIEVVNADI